MEVDYRHRLVLRIQPLSADVPTLSFVVYGFSHGLPTFAEIWKRVFRNRDDERLYVGSMLLAEELPREYGNFRRNR